MSTSPRAASRFGRLAFGLSYAWLLLFFAIPFAIVLKVSLSQSELAQPPYAPAFMWDEGLAAWWAKAGRLSAANYAALFDDDIYVASFVNSVWIAGLSTAASLCIAFPFALALARCPPPWRNRLLLLAMAPFWTSFLVRVYAWVALLKDEGLINRALMMTGLIDAPLPLFATTGAVVIGITYAYLPFMILPLYTAIRDQDPVLSEAARDLGASPFTVFWTITFPLAAKGIVAGSLLVFIPAIGEVVIPDLLGGSDELMIGRTLWNDFFANRDWPAASAAAIVLLGLLVVPLIAYERRALMASDPT